MTVVTASQRVTAAEPAAPPISTQVVFVVGADWNAARGVLARYERDGSGAWQQCGACHPVWIGRSGCAWGRGLHPLPANGPSKREGDGRSPAGIFTIGPAFGTAPACKTGLDYRPMTADDWCIDDASSPHYNRIVAASEVGAAAVAGSTEPMRRDIHRDGDRSYDLGFVIGHNCDCEPGAGSCIFAHLTGDPAAPTAGCIAMTKPELGALLAWLRADAHPRFVLLPAAEATAHGTAWGLPPPPRMTGP